MEIGHSNTERTRAAAGVALVHALLAFALIRGLAAGPVPAALERLPTLIALALPPPPEAAPPPPPPVRRAGPERRRAPGREGAAAPPALRAEATEIVAPEPALPLPIPPPFAAARIPGFGNDPSQGAALVPGPGPGAGGRGRGRGSGDSGDGDRGDGYGGDSPPRHLSGRLRDSDYPAAVGAAGEGGTVSVRFTVALDGRAVDCRITGSSGNAALDAHTCALIERRYRFDPSRDWRGRPVLADVVEDHEWVVRDEPPSRRRGR
jgi:periplasmic protein TonB